MNLFINKIKTFQTFEGLGASGAWWAQIVGGWDNIDPESGIAIRDRISQLLYSKSKGIGLYTYRYNLGAGSKESGNGNYSDPARRAECFESENGEYDFSKDANAVYMMRQAAKDGVDEIILFVNSPIERLTKNHKAHLDKKDSFKTNLSSQNYKAFAKYCLDVTEYFVREGLPIKYISPINEPMWVWNGGQEGCHYSPKQAGKVMLCFADELKKRESLKNIKLSGVENGDIRWFNKSYTREILKYPEVRNCIDSVDLHSYCLPIKPLPKFFNDRIAFVKRFRKWMDKNFPDIPVKMSEWCHMQGGKDSGMSSALETAKVIYEDIALLNVTSWQHWIACSLYDYCDGLIYLDLENQSFELTKRYFVTGNFSKYIPHNAVRFDVTTDDSDVKVLGFTQAEQNVLIFINQSDDEKTVTLPYNTTVAVTDEVHNLEEFSFEKNTDIKISPKSVNTVVFTSN